MPDFVRNNRLLWTLQTLLAALFVFTGVLKLMMPADQLTAGGPAWVSAGLLRFVAVMEILGALGLILPGLVGVRRELTPLAAAGLVIIMIGATAITASTLGALPALLPLCTGIVAATVAYGRYQSRPRRSNIARSH
jgi:hypothetical protein